MVVTYIFGIALSPNIFEEIDGEFSTREQAQYNLDCYAREYPEDAAQGLVIQEVTRRIL